jgi:hypothetical protein
MIFAILFTVLVAFSIWGYLEPEVEKELYVLTKAVVIFCVVYICFQIISFILC